MTAGARRILTERPRRLVATLAVSLLTIPLLLIVLVIGGDNPACGAPTSEGAVSAGTVHLAGYSHGQLTIAHLAVATGEQHHAPRTVILAALMAGNTESGYRNYANAGVPESRSYPHDAVGNDYDSVGPWQLRAGIWGRRYSMAQLMDPRVQADWFFNEAEHVPGSATMDPADLAQRIERSQPAAYAASRRVAETLYTRFHGTALDNDTGTCNPAPGFAPGGDFAHRVIAAAMPFVNRTSYVWGGGGPGGPTGGGFDCSGLVQYAIYQASGHTILLPRTTGTQQNDPRGQHIPWDQRATGDVIYFTSPGQTSSHHTGILLRAHDGHDRLLNSPTTGRRIAIDPLDFWKGEKMDIRRFGRTTGNNNGGDEGRDSTEADSWAGRTPAGGIAP